MQCAVNTLSELSCWCTVFIQHLIPVFWRPGLEFLLNEYYIVIRGKRFEDSEPEISPLKSLECVLVIKGGFAWIIFKDSVSVSGWSFKGCHAWLLKRYPGHWGVAQKSDWDSFSHYSWTLFPALPWYPHSASRMALLK